MSTALTTALVSHILFGLIGLAAIHFAYMQIIRTRPPYHFIILATWLGISAFVTSWLFGGYYYVVHYGGAVKPRILEGGAPWAHQFFMEAKEHVFVLIPFLAIVFVFAVMSLRKEDNPRLKSAAVWLIALAVALGTFSALSGILISGAVR